MAGGGSTWLVKQVAAQGRDVTRAAVTVEDRAISDVTVTMTRQVGTLRGTVRQDTGATRQSRTQPRALTAVAVPGNYLDWTDFELLIDRVLFANVSADGGFRLGPMLPGEYLIAVVDEAQLDPSQGVALVKALATQATRVTVGPGDANTTTVAVARLPR
jgi:hypothetical protein